MGDVDMIVCPCIDCRNIDRHSGSVVVAHLVTRGMDDAYKRRSDWYHHGELIPMAESESNQSQWNDEIVGLYQAAEFLDEEFAAKLEIQLLPIALRGLLPKGPRVAIIPLDSNSHAETLKWLAFGPRTCARSYRGYIVNGQRFHIISVDRKSQNSGVYYETTAICRSSAKDTSQVVDLVSYYGTVTNIILLDYNVFYVPLFRCQWAVKGNRVKEEDGFTLVNLNHSQVSFSRDPYILASLAKQVFYSREDESSSWHVAMRGPSRRFSQNEFEAGDADISPLPANIDMELEPQVQAEQEQLIDTDILNATTAELNGEDPQLKLNEEELEGEVTPNDAEKGLIDEEPEGEIQLSEDHDNVERKSKRQRGPTRMKDIAKDPNTRVHVEFNSLGEPYGKGSVKMASYVGALARFEIDEEHQKTAVLKQMGCLWRSWKSRLLTQIRQANTNQQRMKLRPKNVSPFEWHKLVKIKTSKEFKVVSDSYKERRSKQIPHTTSRKGMVRLAEDMREAAEIVKSDTPAFACFDGQDSLSQLLGPDNPGRMRAMGRNMNKTKLACFQAKNKCMAEMEAKQTHLLLKVNELEDVIEKLKNQRQEHDAASNSAARSVNKRSQPKCILIDWTGNGDAIVAEGRIIISDPYELVNDCRLGPSDVKVLVDTATVLDTYLWRPAPNICTIESAIGQMIVWPASKCVNLENEHEPEDIAQLSQRTNSAMNKCKLLDLSSDDVVVAEGCWQTEDLDALVNGLPLGPNAVKIFIDVVCQPETFIWRPTIDVTYLDDCLKTFVSWPVNKVVFQNTTDAIEKSPPSGRESPIQKSQRPTLISPLRRSPRKTGAEVIKENKKRKLMDISGRKQIVAEGRVHSVNPDIKVHCVRLGSNIARVWVDIVKIDDAAVWRPSDEIEYMRDALGSSIAWPMDKLVIF
ncbi:unnamed protein product [Arabidopsis arenosa]|uniref:Transposase Tnp1/En/Spm-like domain-containing protein n=1 Tax=Arabidopsis arenosa TaxID=38785 RepID=A0A8S2A990_ARAAE|nr:unnamed protein product [Arabidopsis arenosa]